MRQPRWAYILTIILLLTAGAQAQEVSSWLHTSDILIGQPVEYTLRVKMGPGSSVRFEAFQHIIPSRMQMKNGSLATGQVDVEITEEFYDTLIKGKQYDT